MADPATPDADRDAAARHSGVIDVDETERARAVDYVRQVASDSMIALGFIGLSLVGVYMVAAWISHPRGSVDAQNAMSAGVWIVAVISGLVFLGRFIRPERKLPFVARIASGVAGLFFIAPGVINLAMFLSLP